MEDILLSKLTEKSFPEIRLSNVVLENAKNYNQNAIPW
jgi:hypothetical protein